MAAGRCADVLGALATLPGGLYIVDVNVKAYPYGVDFAVQFATYTDFPLMGVNTE